MTRPKKRTLKQVETLQKQTSNGFRHLQEDDSMADEIEEMTPEEFAEWKGIEIVSNPTTFNSTRRIKMPTVKELQVKVREQANLISELEEENQDLEDRISEIRGIIGDDGEADYEDDDFEDEDE